VSLAALAQCLIASTVPERNLRLNSKIAKLFTIALMGAEVARAVCRTIRSGKSNFYPAGPMNVGWTKKS
jgi:hypothetical protein